MDSALYIHACKLYELLESRAIRNQHEELIFEGKLLDVFKETGASQTYYTPVRKLLDSPQDDPCIAVIQRGTAKQVSIIRLNHAPPREWRSIMREDLTAPRQAATLLTGLEARLAALEGWRESTKGVNIVEALRDIESRLSQLEQQAGENQQTGGLRFNGKGKKQDKS